MAPARLEIVDHICEAGTRHNDDIWGASDTAVWIMDGATGLSADRIFPQAPSDAAWFAASIDRCLRDADWSRPASDCQRDAVKAVEAKFRREAANAPSDMSLWPSGAVTIASLREGAVELVNLGDCKLLFRNSEDRMTHSFGTSAVTTLDRMLVEAIVRLQSEGIVEPAAFWSHLVPDIRRNRARMNTPDGYWSLDIAGRAMDHLQELAVEPDDMREFVLLTDGFYRLVDTYRALSDEALLDAALLGGLAELYRELRAIEAQDAGCRTYPGSSHATMPPRSLAVSSAARSFSFEVDLKGVHTRLARAMGPARENATSAWEAWAGCYSMSRIVNSGQRARQFFCRIRAR